MHESIKNGDLKIDTKWKDYYPKIKDLPAFKNMLNQPGCGPLDHFFYSIELLNEEYENNRRKIKDVFAVREFNLCQFELYVGCSNNFIQAQ